jgi:hypothetical protein
MRILLCIYLLMSVTIFAEGKKNAGLKVPFKLLKDFKLPIKDPTFAEKDELATLVKAMPKNVLKFDGKKVKVSGFMVPLKLDKQNKVPLFLLAPDKTSCCFGAVPKLNGFIYCRSSKGFEFRNDIPIEVTGIITTMPFYDDKEECVLIYTMIPQSIKVLDSLEVEKPKGEAEKMAKPIPVPPPN